MMRSLFIAKTGLDTQQTNIDTISNNLANLNTDGYKRQRAIFQDLLYQTLRESGTLTNQQTTAPNGLQLGTGARVISTERGFTQGNLQRTENAFDIAINGEGFFQILQPDGTVAYTRDGTFQKDNTGQIVNQNGYPLQPSITVPQNATALTIGTDGTVSVTLAGSPASSTIGQLQLATFINPVGLKSLGMNLFSETTASGAPVVNTPSTNGMGVVDQFYVETSNVNVAEELIGMIQAQRAYEINSKAITASDEMLRRLTQL